MAYSEPDADIVAIIDAAPTPAMRASPDGAWVLLARYESHPPVRLLARPFRPLAGVRIDPELGARRRTLRILGFSLLNVATGETTHLETPDGNLGMPQWSPDSRTFAFSVDTVAGVELWLGAGKELRRVDGVTLNDVLTGGQLGGDAAFTWARDSGSLLVFAVPPNRVSPVATEPEPAPAISETSGKHSQLSTYTSLLTNEADADEFEAWASAALVRVPLAGTPETLIPAGLFTSVTESPDGRHLLVSRLLRPFSYRVPFSYFARTVEVLSAAGAHEHTVAKFGVTDEIPPDGVVVGPRRVGWSETAPATLWWVEALDGGDPATPATHRDRLLELAAPFRDEPHEWHRLAHRCIGTYRLAAPAEALVVEHDVDRRWVTTWLLSSSDPALTRLIHEQDRDDGYVDPGDPVSLRRADGTRTVVQDGALVLVTGEGATPEGSRPFIGWLDLDTGSSAPILRSAVGEVDDFVSLVGGSTAELLVRHQTPELVPNLVAVSTATGERRRLTDFPHPHPLLAGAVKRLVSHRRADGVDLSGMLHLPPGYDAGRDGPLPLIFWAYPTDYSDASTAGQVRSTPGEFTRLSALRGIWFTLRGFAVLDAAAVPIIGDPETMNDTFVEQLTSSAAAHIGALAAEGIVDPSRVIAMGHSYGGFMTANLLAHTSLFAGGIARSGAYNRTLTPFGFQSERRSFWKAKASYDTMSAFRYADQITDPLLLIHGAADENSGTYPIQSQRLFEAIQATGGTARLVLLPHEGHGYLARESVLHMLAEQFRWAERVADSVADSQVRGAATG